MVDVPPPPPPPEMPEGDPFATIENGNGLEQGAPTVAAKPGRALLVVAVVAIILLFLFYNIFFSRKEKVEEKLPERPVATAPQEPPPLPVLETPPPIASPPPIQAPTIPPPSNIQILTPKDDSAEKAQAQARMHSKILVEDNTGGISAALGGSTQSAPTGSTDSNAAFLDNVTRANTKAQQVEATRIGDLRRTIAQGRIIQATMESALNTELPAPIRAIVSRDTFGEAGTQPLIPKGSRLIGTYNTDITGGQSRVFVVWTRVIRPDGVDVMINSPLVDQIGQAGIAGQVDTKFQQIFSRAVLASVVSIGFAIGSDSVGGGKTTTTTSSLGSSQTGDSASTATVNALNRLGSVSDAFIQRFVDVRPTILIDQGTPVNVFVNRDLIFPGDTTGTRVIN